MQLRELHYRLSRAGFVVVKTNKNHYKVTSPGERGMVVIAGTPSDHRAEKNIEGYLRRTFKRPLEAF